jgi:REP element-mobilizing transposase RayT
MFVEVPPKIAVSSFMGYLKGKSPIFGLASVITILLYGAVSKLIWERQVQNGK